MKQLVTIIISLLSFTLQAQQFDELISHGDQLYEEEKYSESAQEYSKAFAIKEGSSNQYYNAACSWALTGDSIQSLEYLNLSVDKGWRNLEHLKNDPDLESLHETPAWDKILENIQANIVEYEKDFDKPLKSRLEKILVRDQTLRQLYREAEEKFGKDSDKMKYFWEVVAEQDSINEVEVVEIIEERGWVGKSLVGDAANTALWLVIQHAPLETQEKYLPLLKESVLQGESKGSQLALLEDRIQMRNGKPQTYGSQITVDKETGNQVVYEIWEPEYVNQRRKEVGLGPIEYYVKHWGIEWTIEQKEK